MVSAVFCATGEKIFAVCNSVCEYSFTYQSLLRAAPVESRDCCNPIICWLGGIPNSYYGQSVLTPCLAWSRLRCFVGPPFSPVAAHTTPLVAPHADLSTSCPALRLPVTPLVCPPKHEDAVSLARNVRETGGWGTCVLQPGKTRAWQTSPC